MAELDSKSNLFEIQKAIQDGRVKEVRKLYSKQRGNANKRLERLAEAGYDTSEVYREFNEHFITLSEITNNSDLAHHLAEVNRFMNNAMSTLTGQKEYVKESLKKIHKHGYEFVTVDNFRDFTVFMDTFRELKYNKLYDSEQVLNNIFEKLPPGANMEKIQKAFKKFSKNRQKNTSKAKLKRRAKQEKKKGRS